MRMAGEVTVVETEKKKYQRVWMIQRNKIC
jgi:hypothetical protein